MSNSPIPIGLLDTILSLVAGVIFTLVGIVYAKLRGRIEALEEQVAQLESRCIKIKRDLDSIFTWMYGEEQDPTNGGIVLEIEEGFQSIDGDIEALEERLDDVIDELHDEEALEFERDDVEK